MALPAIGAALIPLLQRLLVWLVTNVLLALGLSFVTYTGFTAGLNAIKGYIANNFNNIPADAFNLLMIAGMGECIGIIFGAFAFNAGMAATSRLTARRK